MDRFIAPLTLYVVRVKLEFKIQYGQIYRLISQNTYAKMFDLKSNMDRFIERTGKVHGYTNRYLKSNMDRFIAPAVSQTSTQLKYLKSNMDRFIVPLFLSSTM